MKSKIKDKIKNQNNITAHYYDIINNPLKNSEVTNEEVSLISFLKENLTNTKILDIGVGTGRHLIPLTKNGFQVTGIDSSSEMIKITRNKLDKDNLKATLLNTDIFTYKSRDKFDLIILLWNTFNEIALTKKDATVLISKLNKLLKKDGVILINIDDAYRVNPVNFNFKYEIRKDNFLFNLNWKTEKYFKRTNTSLSSENVVIKDIRNQDIIQRTAYITQRYWRKDEIRSLLLKKFKNIKFKKLQTSKELYIICYN